MSTKLPDANEYGYYEILLESIDRQSMDFCCETLCAIGATHLDLNCQSSVSHCTDMEDAPVRFYISWFDGEKSVLLNSPIDSPNILCIFDERIAKCDDAFTGASDRTGIIINTAMEPEKARDLLGVNAGILYTIDAESVALEAKAQAGHVMLGAIIKAIGFVPLEMAEEAVSDIAAEKSHLELEKIIHTLRRGYNSVKPLKLEVSGV